MYLVIACLLSLFSGLAQASADFVYPDLKWEVAYSKKGVKVYKAEKDEKSGIVPIKFETIIDSPPSRVLAVLADSTRKTEWIPHLKHAHTVKKFSEMEKYEYNIYNSPWPFDDRTFLIHLKSTLNEEKREIVTELKSIDLPEVPVKKDHVRGTTYYGKVIIRNNQEGKTYLEMMFLTDFKGNIPSWIVNLVQSSWPKKMVKNISRQLNKKDLVIPERWLEMDQFPTQKGKENGKN